MSHNRISLKTISVLVIVLLLSPLFTSGISYNVPHSSSFDRESYGPQSSSTHQNINSYLNHRKHTVDDQDKSFINKGHNMNNLPHMPNMVNMPNTAEQIDSLSSQSDNDQFNYDINKSSSQSQVLLYDSFSARDKAITNLKPPTKILYKYQYIPAISVVNATDSLPKEGLNKITPSYKMSKAQEFDLDQQYDSPLTLDETSRLIGIRNLRENFGLTGSGVTIGILDSGVVNDLRSFDNRVTLDVVTGLQSKGKKDQDGHGTHVTGIAASNGLYKIDEKWVQTDSPGMAPKAQIHSIRVLDETGVGENEWIHQGLELAINNEVDIISLSLSTAIYLGNDDPMQLLVQEAIDKGITVISASGNTGPTGSSVGVPAALPKVISVGALFTEDLITQQAWSFSGVGPSINDYPGPDVLAPGFQVLSVNHTSGGPSVLTGTSMAAPHVAGGVALLKEAFPNATVSQIREAILGSALYPNTPDGNIEPVEVQGRGVVQFDIAYQILNETINQNRDSHLQMTTIPNLVQNTNYIYHHRILGETKPLPFFMQSSRNITLVPKIQRYTEGLNVTLPDTINITEGLNRIDIPIHLNASRSGFQFGVIYFIDNNTGMMLPNANITIDSLASYKQSDVLYDIRHDRDTPSGYFANHGPQGQFSVMSRILQSEGHTTSIHKKGKLNNTYLSNYDILVIANPDTPYNSSEITAIQDFVRNQSKSLFVIGGGGIFDAEGEPYAPGAFGTLNDILDGSGISIPPDPDTPYSIDPCNFERFGLGTRSDICVRVAETSDDQNILNPSMTFDQFGPELSIDTSENSNAISLASYSNNPVVAASQFENGGRVMVFSSPMLFDNNGLQSGYNAQTSASTNKEILLDSISWLIEQNQLKLNYKIDDKPLDRTNNLDMHTQYFLDINPTTPNGEQLNVGDTINIDIWIVDIEAESGLGIQYLSLNKSDNGHFILPLKVSRAQIFEIFTPINSNNSIPNSGHIIIEFNLPFYDQQDNFRTIGWVIFASLVVSWLLWINNEGGRLKKEKEEVEMIKEETNQVDSEETSSKQKELSQFMPDDHDPDLPDEPDFPE